MQNGTVRDLGLPTLRLPMCGRAEFRRRRSLCYAKQSSTTPGTSVPPVFTSPELASGTSGTLAGSGTLLKNKAPPPDPRGKNGLVTILKRTFRATERQLSNLQLAIAELAVLAFLSGVGTVIDQEQTLQWYQTNYPDGPVKVLGFLDYNLLFALQLDHIYTSDYFLGISALLTFSLISCSRTQQWPLLKMSKRWSFPSRPEQVFSKGNGETLPRADVKDLGRLLQDRNYSVFLKNGAMYGFKGIAGRFAPIGVHISLILILFGAAYGALAGLDGSAMLSEGDEMLVGAKLRGGLVGLPGLSLPEGARKVVTLEKFDIDYRSDGSVGQYRSILTERDLDGRMEQQKEIYVNEPMRFGGVTIYQTDWALSRIGLKIGSAPDAPEAILRLTEVGSKLGMNASSKIYGTFIPLEVPDGNSTPRGISIIARDLQQVVLYDSKGQFVGVRRPGSGKPIEVEGQQLVVESLSGASGIQLKHDPGVVYVYTGFGFLMITSLLSYISHSQVWALQEGGDVHVGGKSNRAVVMFAQELEEVLEDMPERLVPAVDKPAVKAVPENGSS